MAGPWIVDGNRIASKIRSLSATTDRKIIQWKSNPTKACPNCHHLIDNSDVAQEWPGLPRGVKFDPTDQEIIWHLLAKVGGDGLNPHPFIDEFIPTVDKDDGICYTHPQNLPGMKKDGSVSHFFHRTIKAYNTGTRKRRKIHGDDLGDVRWHKTGRTKPVVLDGVQRGCKKIMVLYMSSARGGKAEKTNWVMHQYHLGTEEEERDGEYIISKIFYDQQKTNKEDKSEEDLSALGDPLVAKVDPKNPKSLTPEPPRAEKWYPDFDMGLDPTTALEDPSPMNSKVSDVEDEVQPQWESLCGDGVSEDKQGDHLADGNEKLNEEMQADDMADGDEKLNEEMQVNDTADGNDHNAEEYPKWWDSESQNLLDSQQLVEALTLCDEFLLSQSPKRDAHGHQTANNKKPSFSDYTQLGPENLKKDLEDCQNLVVDPLNIELDTPPEFRLSQLEFGSQDSFIAWGGGGKIVD